MAGKSVKKVILALVAVWRNTVERLFVNGQWQDKTDAMGNKIMSNWILARTTDLSEQQITDHKKHGLSKERISALQLSYPTLKSVPDVDYVFRGFNDYKEDGEVKFRYITFAPPEQEVAG